MRHTQKENVCRGAFIQITTNDNARKEKNNNTEMDLEFGGDKGNNKQFIGIITNN